MLSILLLAFSCVSALAEPSRTDGGVYLVKADGSGDFPDLQTAIDAVPDGSTVLLSGDFLIYDVVRVHRPLQLVGLDGATLEYLWPDRPDTSVLEIDAGDHGEVLISNLRIDGGANWFAYLPDAVRVLSVGRLIVEESTLLGGKSVVLGYDTCVTSEPAGSGIFVAGSAGTIAVTRSQVLGGDGTTMDTTDGVGWGMRELDACSAGDGIVASAASLLSLNDSEVRGGAGGDMTFRCVSGGYGWGPDLLVAGDGGTGVVGNCYVSNSLIAGGRGGIATYDGCDFGSTEDGAPGSNMIGTRIDLPDQLQVSSAHVGADVTVDGAGFKAGGVAFLLIGSGPVGPVSFRKLGFYFLEIQLLRGPILVDEGGRFHLSGTLPADECLIGVSLALQASDGGPLSEPELIVVQS